MIRLKLKEFAKKYRLYLIAMVLFALWMLVGDEYNLIRVSKDQKKFKAFTAEKEYYQNKLEQDKAQLDAIKGNSDELEKIAREKYKMKKKDEDVFLIVEE